MLQTMTARASDVNLTSTDVLPTPFPLWAETSIGLILFMYLMNW